ncbi:MAG TPA: nucleotide sugar dehydrogenase [Phycisphaerae bacterium]|nr:nucleotide sugar dehydrogenase [Phycisphaerae bacterium]
MLDKQLLNKIQRKQAVVGILGMGYVGLPLARTFCGAGFRTLGYDIDPRKVRMLNAGRSYIKHIPGRTIQQLRAAGLFRATCDPGELRKADALLICVPTPLSKMRDPDMTYVIKTTETIAAHLRRGQLVVLESTTYPGTTREVCKPILENATGLKAEKDFFLAFSPEREDPGREDFTTETITKVVGGHGPKSMKVAAALYGAAVAKVCPVSSCEIAESAKIIENVYRCVNIAMVNELKRLFERMGIDIWEVIEAARTKPFGFQAFYPGPGLGGHCIPIDPFYLTWKAREFGMPTRFIELAGEINTSMPEFVVEHVAHALNDFGKSLKGSRVLVLGLAYKKNIDDIRESPSIELIERLKARGAKVDYNDPYVPTTHKQREHDLQMKSVPLAAVSLKKYDCVVISTDHDCYDYRMIVKNARLIIDTRNACARVKGPKKNVRKA